MGRAVKPGKPSKARLAKPKRPSAFGAVFIRNCRLCQTDHELGKCPSLSASENIAAEATLRSPKWRGFNNKFETRPLTDN